MDFFTESRNFSLAQILWLTLWSTLRCLQFLLRLLVEFVERRILTNPVEVSLRGGHVQPLQTVGVEVPVAGRSSSGSRAATALGLPRAECVRKYYAVRRGFRTGIFTSWPECNDAVKGFSGAEFRGFRSRHDAVQYLESMIPT